MMRQVNIISFREHKERENDKWMELSNGEQVALSEFQIEILWKRWINIRGKKRQDNRKYNIFPFQGQKCSTFKIPLSDFTSPVVGLYSPIAPIWKHT